ncbi:MAG: transketolase [Planctomycetes bacterium]|nr:transketolase [Planctomycetota bacterium]
MALQPIEYLMAIARDLRKDIVEIAFRAQGPSHPGPALSCIDFVTALYFQVMTIDPNDPKREDRDRFVLSKGHAAPALYAALARRGFFPREWLWTLRSPGSALQGHPCMKKTPGVDMTSGSLGNGLAAALGMALYGKQRRLPYRVFCLLGDGECQEGVVWEAAAAAPALRADNLVAIVDYNHFQSCGATEDIVPMEPFADKWRSFNWNVLTMNGHNLPDILNTLDIAVHYRGRPTAIIAHTVKGKGVSFMEHDNSWHQKIPTPEEYEQAMRGFEEAMA